MIRKISALLFLLLVVSCSTRQRKQKNIIADDIVNFWKAYDKITSTKDTILQYAYLDSLYLQKATVGLRAIREVRNYTPEDYITAINNYPKFWNSIRKNTLQVDKYSQELEKGIEKLKEIYPELKPATVYFTIGALRTNGTVLDSLVLIGSELAMTDKNTVSSEFSEPLQEARKTFFETNPIDNLVLLNAHEFIHTQQKPMVYNLLSQVIYEGVAEFVSATALQVSPVTPAIAFGKKNEKRVKERFEHEMFYPNNTSKWLWSNAPNEFGIRDLGYYIGYQMCENFYHKSSDKKQAIKKMIELDYSNEKEVEAFVKEAGFFTTSLDELYERFDKKRPVVLGIKEFENESKQVDSNLKQITINFSQPLNGYNTGVDYGELGENAFPKVVNRVWGEDNKSWTLTVELEPKKEYQLLISNNFRTQDDVPLKPYIVHFVTK